MGKSATTRVRAIRLPNGLWDKIEVEAEGRDESVNAVVARRLDISFQRAPAQRKTCDGQLKELATSDEPVEGAFK